MHVGQSQKQLEQLGHDTFKWAYPRNVAFLYADQFTGLCFLLIMVSSPYQSSLTFPVVNFSSILFLQWILANCFPSSFNFCESPLKKCPYFYFISDTSSGLLRPKACHFGTTCLDKIKESVHNIRWEETESVSRLRSESLFLKNTFQSVSSQFLNQLIVPYLDGFCLDLVWFVFLSEEVREGIKRIILQSEQPRGGQALEIQAPGTFP